MHRCDAIEIVAGRVIKNAKNDLLNKTNISESPDEMKVVDNFLFRCWAMGWLNKYDDLAQDQSNA